MGVRQVRAGKTIAAAKTARTATRMVVTHADTRRSAFFGFGADAAPWSGITVLVMDSMCAAVIPPAVARTLKGMSQPRQPAGVRTGGQFAATAHKESQISLAPRAGQVRDLIGPAKIAARHPAWTPAAIDKFLGDPDKLVRNPVNRSGPKMRMYLASRVAEVESGEDWAAWTASARRPQEKSVDKRPALVGQGRTGRYPVERR